MSIVEIVSVIFGAGGVMGAIVAFIKVQPETSRVIIDSAEGAVVVQSGVIRDLRSEISRLGELCASIQHQLDEERRTCAEEIERLQAAVRSLGSRREDTAT